MDTLGTAIGNFLRNGRVRLGVALVLGMAIGFFGGMEYKAYQLRQVFQDFSDSLNEIGSDEPSNVEEELANSTVIDRNIGDEIVLATLKLSVLDSKEAPTVSTGFGSPVVAKQGAKLVILNVSATNTTPSPFTFWTEGLILVDQLNRSFTAHEDWPDNYLDGRDLSPAIAERGAILYELPVDATSYSFVVGKAGTDEVYRIKLK